ncbi:hypothetical protein D9611_009095 [Ephemerocybe angulata]|uniref:Uncharacterized protein n=2 Tax=Ephemerocybe angulata TaxID=980116 RepID=A0A8H6HYU3_9AGAR|nr:hypothetical protein D9611_009095 [Tulosesus angulatus]KAF6754979.1 hypothetical protein DFP72DRAFT_1123604 [Tulosesus angulatus]
MHARTSRAHMHARTARAHSIYEQTPGDYYKSMEPEDLLAHTKRVYNALRDQYLHSREVWRSTNPAYEDVMIRRWPQTLAIAAAEAGMGHGFMNTKDAEAVSKHFMSMMYLHNSNVAFEVIIMTVYRVATHLRGLRWEEGARELENMADNGGHGLSGGAYIIR